MLPYMWNNDNPLMMQDPSGFDPCVVGQYAGSDGTGPIKQIGCVGSTPSNGAGTAGLASVPHIDLPRPVQPSVRNHLTGGPPEPGRLYKSISRDVDVNREARADRDFFR
jgi:hypothetical protein